tara:strand:- start:1557 stop:1883 length:327 start_codon:yes stop_codon:yes gene_type:complete
MAAKPERKPEMTSNTKQNFQEIQHRINSLLESIAADSPWPSINLEWVKELDATQRGSKAIVVLNWDLTRHREMRKVLRKFRSVINSFGYSVRVIGSDPTINECALFIK